MIGARDKAKVTKQLDALRLHVAEQDPDHCLVALYLPVPRDEAERAAGLLLRQELAHSHPHLLVVYTTSGQPGPTE